MNPRLSITTVLFITTTVFQSIVQSTKESGTMCSLKPNSGTWCTLPIEQSMLRYYYYVGTRKCYSFEYAGCGGNENNFATKQECEFTCSFGGASERCFTAPHPGFWCNVVQRSSITRYYYVPRHRKCYAFSYARCGGNENNFKTVEECEYNCKSTNLVLNGNEDEVEACNMNVDAGVSCPDVNSPPDRYYYSPLLRKCYSFDYAGCSGNGNNFATKNECEHNCNSTNSSPHGDCSSFPDPGVACRYDAGLQSPSLRYYYVPVSGKCFDFIYTGCGGNRNNFVSREECQFSCSVGARWHR